MGSPSLAPSSFVPDKSFAELRRSTGPSVSTYPPPRVHRHRYHGVLAPNSPLRDQVTALAQQTTEETPSTNEATETEGRIRPARTVVAAFPVAELNRRRSPVLRFSSPMTRNASLERAVRAFPRRLPPRRASYRVTRSLSPVVLSPLYRP